MLASLPDNPIYCFAPMNDADGEPPQIRILVEGLAFRVWPSPSPPRWSRSTTPGASLAQFCAAATRPTGRFLWSIIPPPLTDTGANRECRVMGREARHAPSGNRLNQVTI